MIKLVFFSLFLFSCSEQLPQHEGNNKVNKAEERFDKLYNELDQY